METMKTVNEQLNLPLVDGGAVVYQPSQYGKGTEYERGYNYPVLASTLGAPVYSNSTGWSGCNSCGSYSGADGWSNGDGQHSCKQACEGLFAKGEEKTLREACKATCGSRCQMLKCNGFWPTRANICLARGLSSDCTLPASPTGYKGTSPTGSPDDRSGGTSGTGTNTNETKTGMSTGAKIGIAVGAVAVIGAIVYFGFIRKK